MPPAAPAPDEIETEIETETSPSPSDAFDDAYVAAKETHAAPEVPEQAEEVVPAPPAAAPAKPATETGLISEDEFAALQTKHASDPAALRKALEGAFTKKTQSLAAERKSVERLQQYTDIIDAYEADPEATIDALARQHGLSVVREGQTPAAPAAPTPADAAKVAATALDEFKQDLGPEFEYLGDAFAPAITKLVQRLNAVVGETAVEPLKRQLDTLVGRAAEEQTSTLMKTFEVTHPDWKEHEKAMFALSQKIDVNPGTMTELEFLDHLYATVTAPKREETAQKAFEKRVADQVKATVEKMQKGAAAAETRSAATPDHQVRAAPRGLPTIDDAWEAAKRGERWE